jgi:hypothetical protein
MGQVALPTPWAKVNYTNQPTGISIPLRQWAALNSSRLFDKRRVRATKQHQENEDEYSSADAEEMEFPAVSGSSVSDVLRWPSPLRAECIQNH